MKIVGHKDVEIAKRYTNPTDDYLMTAMSKVSLNSPVSFHNSSIKKVVAENNQSNLKAISNS